MVIYPMSQFTIRQKMKMDKAYQGVLKGMTRRQLAAKTGYHYNTIDQWVSLNRYPGPLGAMKLERVTGVKASVFRPDLKSVFK